MSAWRVAFHRSVVRRVFVVWKTTALGFGWPNEAVKGTPQGNDDCSSTYWAAVLLPESPAVLNTCPPALDGAKIAFGFPSKKKKTRQRKMLQACGETKCDQFGVVSFALSFPWRPTPDWSHGNHDGWNLHWSAPAVRDLFSNRLQLFPWSSNTQKCVASVYLYQTDFLCLFLSLYRSFFFLTNRSRLCPTSISNVIPLSRKLFPYSTVTNVFDNLYLSLR